MKKHPLMVYVEPEQYAELVDLKHRTGASIGATVRDAIAEHLAPRAGVDLALVREALEAIEAGRTGVAVSRLVAIIVAKRCNIVDAGPSGEVES